MVERTKHNKKQTSDKHGGTLHQPVCRQEGVDAVASEVAIAWVREG